MTFKKKIIVSVLVLAIGWGGYYWYSKNTNKSRIPTTRTVKVSTGSLSSTIKATGNISAMQESTLSFARDGIVSAILKQEGESVKTGDIIAKIDPGTAELDLETAQRNLSDAQASYNELFDSATASDLSKAKATLEQSKASLALLEKQYENLLVSQKSALSQAQASLDLQKKQVQLTESELEYTKKNISTDTDTNNIERDVASAWLTVQTLSTDLPDVLKDLKDVSSVDNKLSSIYGDIGSKNTTVKAETDTLYPIVVSQLDDYKTAVTALRDSGKQTDFDSVQALVVQWRDLSNQFSKFANLIIEELDYTPETGSFSSDSITTAKTTVKASITTINNKLSSLNSTYTTLKNYGSDDLQALSDKNTVTAKEQSLISAQNNLKKAEQDFDQLKSSQEVARISSQNDLARQKDTITQNQYSYNDLIDGPKSAEVRSASSKVESAKISLAKAEKSMEDYEIIANFDGTIEDIPWKVGESEETTKGILVANKDAYKIELSLDQIDIVKVKEGMEAQVVLDAFSTQTFTGTVTSISATPTITSGVVSYTATVGLSITGVTVMSNMTTTVTIIVSNKEDVILIPSGAITSENGKSYVNVQTWGQGSSTEKREVTLGTISDGKTEISSGLTIGETISYTPVMSTSSTTTSTSSTKTTNTDMGGGMGGPPGGF